MPPNDPNPIRNIVETALDAGRRQVVEAKKSPLEDGVPYVIVRSADGSERVEYLKERFPAPARKTGTVKLNDEASFTEFWKRHAILSQSAIYGNIAPASFVAVFNDHAEGAKGEPDFRDHRAVYAMNHSKEWQEWKGKDKQRFEGAVAFAEWLENHVIDIVTPEGAKMLEIALNLRVTANAAYSKAVRLSDGNTEFTYTNQVEGSANSQSGKVQIPETFAIAVPVFEGIDVQRYHCEARFRYRLNGSALSVWYELVRPHKIVEQAFKDILTRIEQAAGTKVLFGSPE